MQFFYVLLTILNVKSIFSLATYVDLAYSIKAANPIFPGLVPFNYTQRFSIWAKDDLDEYYFKAANTFVTGEHFGTHIDAPYHGSNTSWTVEQIPFNHLVSIKGLIVDVSLKSKNYRNYQIQIEDLDEYTMKTAEGYYVLLFYTGKSLYWPDQIAYAGSYYRSKLDFPGLSAELASYLADSYADKLVGVGIDTLSIDPGSSKHFKAHRILFKQNIYALENVAALNVVLDLLSDHNRFFSLDVLPMKIEGGTGAPCRLVARIEDPETPEIKCPKISSSYTPTWLIVLLIINCLFNFVCSIPFAMR